MGCPRTPIQPRNSNITSSNSMPRTHWHSRVKATAEDTDEGGFVCMSTVDDLSYTPSPEERARDAEQIVATGRRSWKTLKGKGEAVWPPHLEAALIEALERYHPDGPRSTKVLGRFPMRNRFISDYIYEITGKRRTPKQVGSRLQQLRDTCKGKKILHLISRRSDDNSPETPPSSTTSSRASSENSRSFSSSPPPDHVNVMENQRTVVYAEIALNQPTWPGSLPVIHFIANARGTPLSVLLAPRGNAPPPTALPRDSALLYMDPTVTFASPYSLVPHSTFSVFIHGDGEPIHTEVVPLRCHSSPVESSGWIYSTTLIPGFWKALCDGGCPSRFTIVQNMTAARSNRTQSPGHSSDALSPTISVIYQFSPSELSLDIERASHVYNSYPEYQCDQVSPQYPRSIHSQWLPLQDDPLEWGHGQEAHSSYHGPPAYIPPNQEPPQLLYAIQRPTGSLKPLLLDQGIHNTQNQAQFQSPETSAWPIHNPVVYAVPSYPYQSYPSYAV